MSPQEVLLAQFSLYVHKGGLNPIHFISFRRVDLTSGTTITRHWDNAGDNIGPNAWANIGSTWSWLRTYGMMIAYIRNILRTYGVMIAYVRDHDCVRTGSWLRTYEIRIAYVRDHDCVRTGSWLHTYVIMIAYVRDHDCVHTGYIAYVRDHACLRTKGLSPV